MLIVATVTAVVGGVLLCPDIQDNSSLSKDSARSSFHFSKLFVAIVVVNAVLAIAFLGVGLFLPSMRITTQGAAGNMLPLMSPASPIRDFSLLDFISAIPSSVPAGWSLASLWTVAIVVGAMSIGFSLLAPVAIVVCLLVTPRNSKLVQWLFLALRACAIADIWALQIGGSCLELQKVADKLLEPSIGALNAFANAFPNVFGATTAFTLSVTPLLGFWFLFVGALLLVMPWMVFVVSFLVYDRSTNKPNILYRAAAALGLIQIPSSGESEHHHHYTPLMERNE
jgi:hypothetical protein